MPKNKNTDYWRKRFEENQKNILKPADDYIVEIGRIFKQAENDIEKEIALWYQRFADNNGITDISEARKLLNGKELKELKWNVEEYIKHGRENGIYADWAKELENASDRVHISRLEALKLQCRQYIENLYNSIDSNTRILIESIYRESMYHTAYEIAKGIGVSTSFAAIDTERLKKIILKPWSADGTNFSEKIWGGHRKKLVNTLYNQLTRGILTGKSPNKIINETAKTMNTSKNNVSRLVMTESAYFASEAQKESFKRLGTKRYQILGTLDSSTCSECGTLDGKDYDMKEFETGVTAPPFHPRCRCTTVPYFDDEFTEGEERFARDKDGNGIYVDADMTYEDWKEKFVHSEKGVAKYTESDIIRGNNVEKEDIQVHFVGRIDKNIYGVITKDIVTDEVIITDERINHIKERHPNDFEQYCFYMKEIIENPDYIILGNKPNTALILKSFNKDEEQFKTILRIITSSDDKNFKNSIITFMKINNKEWERLLRNKEILYKKE